MFRFLRKFLFNQSSRRALVAIICFILFWEIGSKSAVWFGMPIPWVGKIPAPSTVVTAWIPLITDSTYWASWVLSTRRVFSGFITAMIIGIPFGLLIAVNRTAYGVMFPTFEVLRPIPPLAWVPAAIIFWPTNELSIAFVTFLGAFYTIVINVLGGAQSIDQRFFQAARSMGSSQWDIFKRIVLPAVVPSIAVGASVGMGITWNVVIAAEMISGGGSDGGGKGGGLGFFIWDSYLNGSYELIVVGMISIGIAGYLSSGLIRIIGDHFTKWTRR
jgi:NitT/TauT family transport system permease protein